MASVGYDITIIGFVITALLALGFLWLARRDRWRSIRFGFFFEHERRHEDDPEVEEHTKVMWPGEKEERSGKG